MYQLANFDLLHAIRHILFMFDSTFAIDRTSLQPVRTINFKNIYFFTISTNIDDLVSERLPSFFKKLFYQILIETRAIIHVHLCI